MSDEKLDALLRSWGEADFADDVGRDCPPLSVLWYHEADGRDLGDQADHVAGCGRCARRRGLIRAELARAKVPRVLRMPVRSPVRWGGGALALAASIALAFVLWPQAEQPSLEDQIAVLWRYGFAEDDNGASRGAESTGVAPPLAGGVEPEVDAMPEWVAGVRADPDVRSALEALSDNEVEILSASRAGEITLDPDTGLNLSPDFDAPTARTEGLLNWIERDRQTIDQVVEALLRHLPDASQSDRAAVRQAVNRRRATQVFGRLNHSAP